MFDEIPKPSKARTSRKQAWLWIGICVLWLAMGSRNIIRHRDFGWLVVAAWAFCLLVWSWRLVASYRDDAQKDSNLRKSNGQ